MDEKEPTAEKLVREMLGQFISQEDDAVMSGQPPLKNPEGLLTGLEEWGSKHPDAAAGLIRVVVGAAAAEAAASIPFAPLLTDIMESAIAFGALADDSIDDFLRVRAPRVVTGPNGTTKWAVLTAVTDREALVREVVGPSSGRPHYRPEPPAIDVHLAEAHHADALRDALGLPLRQVLEIDEDPTPKRAETLFRPLIAGVRASSPELGEGLAWLVKQYPNALLAMPTTLAVLDALQGNTEPRPGLRLRFAHLLDLEGLGYCVLLMWDTEARLNRRARTVLAGHIRHLSDTAVAPWNRYPDLRRRREAFGIWVRHLRDDRIDAQGLADMLRSRHAANYKNEPRPATIARIYRISTELSSGRLPQGLMKLLREDRENATREALSGEGSGSRANAPIV